MPKPKREPKDQKDSVAAKSSGERSMRQVVQTYIESAKAGLYLVSFEEIRVEADLKAIAKELEFRMYCWSITSGLVCVSDTPPTQIAETEDPVNMILAFQKLPEKSIVIARDLHMMLGDAQNTNALLVRAIKDAIKVGTLSNRVHIILGCRLKLVAELEKE